MPTQWLTDNQLPVQAEGDPLATSRARHMSGPPLGANQRNACAQTFSHGTNHIVQ
jgi:hypothetical protein